MIMFQASSNNFVNLDSNSNQTDVSTKSSAFNNSGNQFQSPGHSPATSNLSEDVSIKSENLFSLDANIDQNYSAQNFDQHYDQSIEHLVNLVDKYESQMGNYDEQSYNDAAPVNSSSSFGEQTFVNAQQARFNGDASFAQQEQPHFNADTNNSLYAEFNDQQSAFSSVETNAAAKSISCNKMKGVIRPTNNTATANTSNRPSQNGDHSCAENIKFKIVQASTIKQEPDHSKSIANDELPDLSENNQSFDLASNHIKLDLDSLEFKSTHLALGSNGSVNKLVDLNGKLELNVLTNQPPEAVVVEKRIPRPPNAFMIFGQQNRKLLATQFPQYTNKQISKILGDEWRKMKLEDKAHFHRLAEEAYNKHMAKYPGYYYSPLEARQRKADRKKKFFQKINSRRSYVRQQQSTSSTDTINEDAGSVQLSQLISFQNAAAVKDTNDQLTNEINAQVKILKQQAMEKSVKTMGVKSGSSSPTDHHHHHHQSIGAQTAITNHQSPSQQQTTTDLQHPTASYHSNLNQQAYNSLKANKFENQQLVQHQLNGNNNEVQQQQNCFQQQPNRLFCTHSALQNNNMIRHLFSGNQNGTSSSNGHQNNLSDVLAQNAGNVNNNAASFLNHQSNGALYHYHHHPTIYHVTTKDPNLNSTLTESTAAGGGYTNGGNSFNNTTNLSNGNTLNSNSLTNNNGINLNLNFNNNFANNLCNSANQLILTNQLLLQHQQLYQHQLAQQQSQSEMNSLSVFLPQMDTNNNSTASTPTAYHQYATNVAQHSGQQTQFSLDEIISEAERQQNNFFSNNHHQTSSTGQQQQQAMQQVSKSQMNKLLVKWGSIDG